MSMLRHAANGALQQQLVLLYSNRRPEDCALLTELQRLEGDHRYFRLVATMTPMGRSRLPWTGATGRIDEALVRRVTAELANPVYYVAGPPAMVTALRDELEDAGIAADDIRSEEFWVLKGGRMRVQERGRSIAFMSFLRKSKRFVEHEQRERARNDCDQHQRDHPRHVLAP